MKKVLVCILLCSCLSQAKEVKSFHPDSGTLIISDDQYSLSYRDKDGNVFSLYSFNDGYASRVEGGEKYIVNPDKNFFSETGKYFAYRRNVYKCEKDTISVTNGKSRCGDLYNTTYMDVIDMTTGCVVNYISGLGTSVTNGTMGRDGFWIVDKFWISNDLYAPSYEINILEGHFPPEMANNNRYLLCNRDQVNNKPFYYKLLAQLKKFDSIENNKNALDLATEVNAYGLANILSKNNVVFLNNLAFYLANYFDQINGGEFQGENVKYEYASRVLLEAILKKFPERTVAYLNLADGYYKREVDHKLRKESKILYRKYYDLMVKHNKKDKIPKRVYDRMGN